MMYFPKEKVVQTIVLCIWFYKAFMDWPSNGMTHRNMVPVGKCFGPNREHEEEQSSSFARPFLHLFSVYWALAGTLLNRSRAALPADAHSPVQPGGFKFNPLCE